MFGVVWEKAASPPDAAANGLMRTLAAGEQCTATAADECKHSSTVH